VADALRRRGGRGEIAESDVGTPSLARCGPGLRRNAGSRLEARWPISTPTSTAISASESTRLASGAQSHVALLAGWNPGRRRLPGALGKGRAQPSPTSVDTPTASAPTQIFPEGLRRDNRHRGPRGRRLLAATGSFGHGTWRLDRVPAQDRRCRSTGYQFDQTPGRPPRTPPRARCGGAARVRDRVCFPRALLENLRGGRKTTRPPSDGSTGRISPRLGNPNGPGLPACRSTTAVMVTSHASQRPPPPDETARDRYEFPSTSWVPRVPGSARPPVFHTH